MNKSKFSTDINTEMTNLLQKFCNNNTTGNFANNNNSKSAKTARFKLDPNNLKQEDIQVNKNVGISWTNEKEEKIFVSNIFSDHGFSKRPTAGTYCQSKNGKNILEIHSTEGLPYGHDKDLIFLICNLAIETHDRELYFHSKAEILRGMDKIPHSDTIKRLIESLYRLINTTFTFHNNNKKKAPFIFQLFESVNFVNQSVTLTLSEEFYDHLTKKETKLDKITNKRTESLANLRPFDRRVLKELRDNRIAVDTFTFASFRSKSNTARMNVLDLMGQIQSGIQSAKQFVKNFTGKVANKIGSAFKKVYNIDLPKGFFKILPSGRGHKKSFTLEIKGGCQLIPPLIT